GHERLGAADSDFSGGGIGEEFDISYSLPQLVEHYVPAFQQSTRINRRLDAARAAVQQADAERVFEPGDRFRDGGLRHAEMRGRLGHASPLHDSEKNMEVAQLETPADSALPVQDRVGHCFYLYQ